VTRAAAAAAARSDTRDPEQRDHESHDRDSHDRDSHDPRDRDSHGEPIKDALQQTLEEARMVLPGVQTLFGFQLIAVFSEGFARRLSEAEQSMHLGALMLVTIAIALLMTPAAYHRQVDPRRATVALLKLASHLISGAMLPLAGGLALDLYLVARVITDSHALAAAIGIAALTLFLALWFVLPRWRAAQASARTSR
jgi:hypothetical protein